jgi:two-component system phosphate regulon response regulator PhoB
MCQEDYCMPEQPLILIVDDEEDVRDLVAANLKRAGFATAEAPDGVTALRMARMRNPDAVVLDVMMPGKDGFAVCAEMRADDELRQMPVVMLTARGMTEDRILGLMRGADDYVAKPFSPKELILRVQAVLRRSVAQPDSSMELKTGPFHFDISAWKLMVDGEQVELTFREFRLLHMLASHKGKVLSREAIMSEVWGYSDHTRTRTLDTHVRRVREKLGNFSDWLQTMRSFGYYFKDPQTESEPEPATAGT